MEHQNCGKQQGTIPSHPDTVHLVFPLKIIAPPGSESRVPRPLDTFNAFNAYCVSLNKQAWRYATASNASGATSSAGQNGHFNGAPSYDHEVKYNPKSNTSAKPPARSFNCKGKSAKDSIGTVSRKAIVNLLRTYHALCRNIVYEQEVKGKEDSTGKETSSKGNYFLTAGAIVNKLGMGLKSDSNGKIVGPFPGVEVGDHFYYRMELCCLGLHYHLQGGIDYTSARSNQYDVSIATSIVSSGSYNDTDDGEVLIYTGQGGRSALDKKPSEDQKMERGNLALENSMKHNVPVRVVRGIKAASGPTGKIYTYDGLYRIESCWLEKGKFGFGELKFKLVRLPGQPVLGSALLKLSKTVNCGEREGVLVADISCGKEAKPVCVVNSVDDVRVLPYFEYSTNLECSDLSTIAHGIGYTQGCKCEGECSADEGCACFARNSNAFPYLRNGILVKERGIIYECGTHCRCSPSCWNRSTQRPSSFRFEVFRTDDRGWGLRSWDSIPAGSFICEYTGKQVGSAQALQIRNFELNLKNRPSTSTPWGHVSEYLGNHVLQGTEKDVRKPEIVIDSSQCGNAARFINHSCFPNVLVQCIVRSDSRCPHVMLFAMDNLPPFKELTRDYGSDSNPLGNKKCLCNSEDCRGIFSG